MQNDLQDRSRVPLRVISESPSHDAVVPDGTDADRQGTRDRPTAARSCAGGLSPRQANVAPLIRSFIAYVRFGLSHSYNQYSSRTRQRLTEKSSTIRMAESLSIIDLLAGFNDFGYFFHFF